VSVYIHQTEGTRKSFTGHSIVVCPYYGSCFMSLFLVPRIVLWLLDF